MDLCRRLDEVLQVCPVASCNLCKKSMNQAEKERENAPREEVAEVDELAVPLVLDVDHAPAVLAATHGLAVDDDGALGAHDGEGDHVLHCGAT